ncbi:MAG: ABC transporter permease [Vicinamibacteria bacterium]|nr:ABC transporter permease [Vicinamibacteria bacterium]
MSAQSGPPTFEIQDDAQGRRIAVLGGDWSLRSLRRRHRGLALDLSRAAQEPDREWDLREIDRLDAAGAVLLFRSWGRALPGRIHLREQHAALFDRLGEAPRLEPAARYAFGDGIAALGARSFDFVMHLASVVTLLGRLSLDFVSLLPRPGRAPWREISAGIYRAGVTALPITALVGFLIGIVVSYLSAQQLRAFGANIFIVNLLGISVLRELGPLLAAILVAGRSGSSMTAQIGVMRLTQELDALSAMGISYSQRLVMPRVVSLSLALPLLVLWTDALALWGGILAAEHALGIGPQLFLLKLPDAVPVANLWLGVGKGAVFGFLIALTACHFGLKIEPDTKSLGQYTTRSVVASITLVILADAVFAILTSHAGLT